MITIRWYTQTLETISSISWAYSSYKVHASIKKEIVRLMSRGVWLTIPFTKTSLNPCWRDCSSWLLIKRHRNRFSKMTCCHRLRWETSDISEHSYTSLLRYLSLYHDCLLSLVPLDADGRSDTLRARTQAMDCCGVASLAKKCSYLVLTPLINP